MASQSRALEARRRLGLAGPGEPGDQALGSCLLGGRLKEWQEVGGTPVSAPVTGLEVQPRMGMQDPERVQGEGLGLGGTSAWRTPSEGPRLRTSGAAGSCEGGLREGRRPEGGLVCPEKCGFHTMGPVRRGGSKSQVEECVVSVWRRAGVHGDGGEADGDGRWGHGRQ